MNRIKCNIPLAVNSFFFLPTLVRKRTYVAYSDGCQTHFDRHIRHDITSCGLDGLTGSERMAWLGNGDFKS